MASAVLDIEAPLIEALLPATFTAPDLSDADFEALCAKFPDSMIEYTPDGTVTLMPPTDPETGVRSNLIVHRLTTWAIADGRGHVVGPDAGFRLPDRSRRSPDAAWFDNASWKAARQSGQKFPVFAPEFIIEMRSSDDKIWRLREKMEHYIENGVQLGWLIDPIERNVTIYRPGQAPEILVSPASITGEGVVAGFVLDLDRIL